PFTWLAVADELRRHGWRTVVPNLETVKDSERSFHRRHAASVVKDLRATPRDRKLILVGHSGAGALLPSVALAARHPAAASFFVDAGIPKDGESRIGHGPFAIVIRDLYPAGVRFPDWTDDELREDVPNDGIRGRLLADVRPPP